MRDHLPLPAMLEAILDAAREKFPGNEWPEVEVHLHKAWNAVAHDTPWEVVRAGARRAWEEARE
ncbi:hypothetical protein [Cognatiluteimonas lumbrici]|uniref:hypothetical protein n=1 Tax=Cognatiluteimonas lumbrici TaxID=2559601 RepID=UPI00112DD7D0|nr:hypothetical protein [Luteimonas lumbrici]